MGVEMGFGQWLISVVLAGLGINLLAMYLKPRIDGLLNRYSDRRRARSAKREQDFQATVERFAAKPNGRLEVGQELQYWVNQRGEGFLLIVLSLLLVGISNAASDRIMGALLLVGGSVILLFASISFFIAAQFVTRFRSLQRGVWGLTGGQNYDLEYQPDPPPA